MSRYTIDELKTLRASPLVKKPDSLPSIDQWLDQGSQDHQQPQPSQPTNPRKARNQNGLRDDNNGTQMGNFAAQRPSLLTTRHPSRASATASGMSDMKLNDLPRVAANLLRTLQADGLLEDIVLGPPKTSFASSRTRPAAETNPVSDDADDDSATTASRSRFFQEKSATPLKSDRAAWRTGRTATDEEERNGGDRERYNSRRDRNAESLDEPNTRRNGYGQRSDQRWSRDGDRPASKIAADGQRGGWRERERARQDNHYGGREQHAERAPEWMDEPNEDADTVAQNKTNDFEKWKASQKMASKSADHKEEAPPPPVDSWEPTTQGGITPAAQDPGFGQLFGTWGESKPQDSPAAVETAPPKLPKTPAVAKSSRFASIFAPPRPVEEMPPSPVVFKQASNGSSEDVAGFNRIMSMLGKQSDSAGSTPAQAGGALGALFGAPSGPPQQQQPQQQAQQGQQHQHQHHQQQNVRPASFSRPPPDAVASFVDKKPSSVRPGSGLGLEAFMSPQPGQDRSSRFMAPQMTTSTSNIASPNPSHLRSETTSQPQPQHPFMDQQRHMQHTPESLNVQQIVAGGEQAQKSRGGLNKDSEFLLNLINQKVKTNANAVQQNQQTSQQAQHHQRQPSSQQSRNDQDFQLFLDQPSQRSSAQPNLETHAPKPQQPHRVPGALEEQLMQKGVPNMNMGPPNDRNMDQPQPRGQQQRVPPGFYEDPAIMQHQAHIQQQQQQHQQMQPGRRQAGQPGQSQGLPDHLAFPGPPPPGFNLPGPPPQSQAQGSSDRLPPPPPGFPANMRHPAGFAGIPGIFQPPQQTGDRASQQQGGRLEFPPMMQGPGGLAQMQGHAPPQGPPQSLGQGQGIHGMGAPPPLPHLAYMGMGAPPPPLPMQFFGGMPPPPGFLGGPPPPSQLPPSIQQQGQGQGQQQGQQQRMMSPPGFSNGGQQRGALEGVRSPEQMMQGLGLHQQGGFVGVRGQVQQRQ